MKKIQFNSVKIQNFLSVGKKPLEITFQKGINLITGENKDKGGKNGIGKSSILEAIYWCLFGNTIRDIKNDKIIHNLNKKDCKVSLTFEVVTEKHITPYTIERFLEPSKVTITAHNQQRDIDMTLSTIPETNAYIKNLLGATEEVFQNAVIMSANNTVPFMAQKKTDKRKFIEGILNLNIFSDMLLKARGDYNDFKRQNDTLSNNFINLQRNLSTFEDQKANAETKKQEKITVLKNKYKEYEKERDQLIEKNKDNPTIDQCNKEINDLENNKLNVLKIGLKAFKKTKEDLVAEFSAFSVEIKQLEKEKQKIIDKGNTCPTCNREYCEDDIKTVNQRLKDIDLEISIKCEHSSAVAGRKLDLDDKIEELEQGINKINIKIRALDSTKSNVKLYMQKLSNIATSLQDCLSQIDEVKKDDSSIETNIENTKKEIEKTESELTSVKKQMAILDTVKFIVSEEGVKTYIVKKMLTLLNKKLNYYLKELDTPCKCEFNDMFEETIINESGKECSYFNFSGGERKRIDIAILFMFQDLLRSQTGTSYSLNIYDEMIDSALDQQGTDKIIGLLKEKVTKYDESVYIVSHKSSDMARIDNVLLLEKENGVTKIVS